MNGAPDPKRVDASPAKRFFVSMLVRDIELMPAIIDLVDNSADGAKRLRPEPADDRYEGLFVHVTVSPESFEIKDNCGGIDAERARSYAFKFGRAEDEDGPIGEVGQFGIGMKRALFKMGDEFRVESTSQSSRFVLPVNVADWVTEPGADWSFKFESVEEGLEVPAEETETTILVEKLRDLVSEAFGQELFVNRLRRQIATRELRLIQQGLEIKVNEEKLEEHEPLLLSGDDLGPMRVDKEIPANGRHLDMKLWAGLVESAAADDDDVDDGEKYRTEPPAGWYLFCNDRLLLYADKSTLTGWGSEAAAYHPQYGRFRGYVFLTGDAKYMPWNTTKTGVDEDSRVFREVQNEMFDALQKVQAVINRLKKERRQADEAQRPAVTALDAARPVPLDEVPVSIAFRVPDEPPDPPPTAQWIRYQVDLADFERAADAVGSEAPSEVGRATFDFYLEDQVD